MLNSNIKLILQKIFVGMLLLVCLQTLALAKLSAMASAMPMMHFSTKGFLLAQMLCVIPLISWLGYKEERDIIKGILIGVVLTTLEFVR